MLLPTFPIVSRLLLRSMLQVIVIWIVAGPITTSAAPRSRAQPVARTGTGGGVKASLPRAVIHLPICYHRL